MVDGRCNGNDTIYDASHLFVILGALRPYEHPVHKLLLMFVDDRNSRL